MKQVIVTGGRDYDDWVTGFDVLDFINPDVVVQGGASGADKMAKEWAELNIKDSITVKADWDKHGRSAGPIRNREMLEKYPDAIIVAFPGGAGTADCVSAAVSRNRIILQVRK